MASPLLQVLNAIASNVTSLGLTDPQTGLAMPVFVKKLPRSQSGIDLLPGIYVYRSDAPEEYKRMAFGGNDSVDFLIYIVIVTPGDQDLTSNIDAYATWRDEIESLFKPPNIPGDPPLLVGVPGVWDLKIDPDVWEPRQQLNINYDYNAVGVIVSVTKTN